VNGQPLPVTLFNGMCRGCYQENYRNLQRELLREELAAAPVKLTRFVEAELRGAIMAVANKLTPILKNKSLPLPIGCELQAMQNRLMEVETTLSSYVVPDEDAPSDSDEADTTGPLIYIPTVKVNKDVQQEIIADENKTSPESSIRNVRPISKD
jgi:hypothetical protein